MAAGLEVDAVALFVESTTPSMGVETDRSPGFTVRCTAPGATPTICAGVVSERAVMIGTNHCAR